MPPQKQELQVAQAHVHYLFHVASSPLSPNQSLTCLSVDAPALKAAHPFRVVHWSGAQHGNSWLNIKEPGLASQLSGYQCPPLLQAALLQHSQGLSVFR